jgi:hypothetical protein
VPEQAWKGLGEEGEDGHRVGHERLCGARRGQAQGVCRSDAAMSLWCRFAIGGGFKRLVFGA